MEYQFKKRAKTADRRTRKFSADRLSKGKSYTSFKKYLQNPAKYCSANTLRNSIIPQSFTKGQRFLSAGTGGAKVEFTNVSNKMGSNIASSFGHGNKFTFKAMNNNPGPGCYDITSKRQKKNRRKIKCTFGITYDERKTCDINKDIKVFNWTAPGPGFYNDILTLKKSAPKYSLKRREKSYFDKKSPNPPPTQYTLNEKAVKCTKFMNVSFGKDIKSILKDIPQTPGPADYETVKRRESKSIVKSRKSHVMQLRPTSRECSLAVPLSGEPFSPLGALKRASRIIKRKRAKMLGLDFI
ncbi:unnamed protein product [Moneuplotes crassus]|uniref:Uncharacterized protein n=1 Tax=Euplotes crassus TaxID=5936 RepID=A0AAD1XKL6_EUPCR|nr:unnamed protein product [Moneuplotes crassus]